MYERYCELRDLRGIKDAEVSKITGITKSTFTDWKNGKSKPNADKLIKIAKCLNTTVEYLMTGETKEFSIEVANEDTKLIFARKELKECFLKILDLPKDKQDKIISLIDMF